MNYLFHCWLGRSDDGLKAGGFLGDFIKGELGDNLPIELKRGLQLHRHIDAISNRLPSMRASYSRFGPELRRPAPILLDLMADHYLAKYWEEFGEGHLTDFTKSCYSTIGQYEIPPGAHRMYEHACQTDLFARYADLAVIEDIMHRILQRLKFTEQSALLSKYLRMNEVALKHDFDAYYADLLRCADSWLASEQIA